MLRTILFMLLSSIVISGESTESNGQIIQPTFQAIHGSRFSLEGPVNHYLEAVTENWLLRAPDANPGILKMFANRDRQPYADLLPWSGEFAGKYLTCVAQMLPMTQDPRLEKYGAAFVDSFIEMQAEDGYLGPFPLEYRLTGQNANGSKTWDAWGHYHAMLGLILWYDHTGDEDALNCASRIGDLLCKKFRHPELPISSTGSTEMNQAVVHSLTLLFQRTNNQKYLALAEEIVQDFAVPNAGDFLRTGLNGVEFFQTPKPRWESLHPLMGLAELYWTTGNAEYRTAFEHFWWSIVKLDRHNNGGFSSGEQAHGNPYHPGAIETCCTIAWMAMSVEMLKMTGDSRVADELELSTLNQAIAMHSPSGKWCTYNTPMDGRRIPSTTDIAFQIRPGSEELNCCSVNAARAFGMIAEWALLRDGDGLVLNWYGPSQITTQINNIPVSIHQTTRYPLDGKIEILVNPKSPARFPLKLRIPHWSTDSTLKINGVPVSVQPGHYAVIDRKWKSGDRIEIKLDMSLRFWKGKQEYKDRTSIYRGPILLTYESDSPETTEFSPEWKSFGHFRTTARQGAAVQFNFIGDVVQWHGFYFDDAGKTRISIDGKEIEIVDQYGPTRETPFVWKRTGLGPGKHTLRLDVLGKKSEQSTNTWINVREFKAAMTMSALDANQLTQHTAPISISPGFVQLNVKTPTGETIRLRDFAGAGQGGATYFSWLPVSGVAATPFSKDNPSRTSRAAKQ